MNRVSDRIREEAAWCVTDLQQAGSVSPVDASKSRRRDRPRAEVHGQFRVRVYAHLRVTLFANTLPIEALGFRNTVEVARSPNADGPMPT